MPEERKDLMRRFLERGRFNICSSKNWTIWSSCSWSQVIVLHLPIWHPDQSHPSRVVIHYTGQSKQSTAAAWFHIRSRPNAISASSVRSRADLQTIFWLWKLKSLQMALRVNNSQVPSPSSFPAESELRIMTRSKCGVLTRSNQKSLLQCSLHTLWSCLNCCFPG